MNLECVFVGSVNRNVEKKLKCVKLSLFIYIYHICMLLIFLKRHVSTYNVVWLINDKQK